VLAEVVAEVVHQIDGVVVGAGVGGAIKQHLLSAKHLWNFGQDSGSTDGGQFVGDPANQGVGGNAGESIGSAALHADDQFAGGDGGALELAGVLGEFADQIHAIFQLVIDVLRIEVAEAVSLSTTQAGNKILHLVVFTPQTEQEDRSGIGMVGQTRKQLLRIDQIVAELRAAEGMIEGVDAIDGAAAQLLVGEIGNARRGVVHTADGIDDPDFIANAHRAIGTAVALKGSGLGGGRGFVRRGFEVAALQAGGHGADQVMRVNVLTGANILAGYADGVAILDDGFSGAKVAESNLVSRLNIGQGGEIGFKLLSSMDCAKRYSDIVGRMDTKENHGPGTSGSQQESER